MYVYRSPGSKCRALDLRVGIMLYSVRSGSVITEEGHLDVTHETRYIKRHALTHERTHTAGGGGRTHLYEFMLWHVLGYTTVNDRVIEMVHSLVLLCAVLDDNRRHLVRSH